MAWAKLDDRFYDHPKIERLSLAARGLFVTAISYAASHQTDGLLSEVFIKRTARGRPGKAALRELTISGLFEPAEGGVFRIHDYLDYNPGKAQLQGRQSRQARMTALRRNHELVDAIKLRDADHCRYCGRRVDWMDRRGTLGATYDHVDPRADNALDNVVIACRGCNSTKGDRTPAEAAMPLLAPHGAQVGFGLRPASDLDTDLHTRVGPGGGSTEATTENSELHAQVDEVLAILDRSPRFTVDEVATRIGVENAIAAAPAADPVEAARTAVVWASDPAWRKTNPASCLLDAMRKQPPKSVTPMTGGHGGSKYRCVECNVPFERHALGRVFASSPACDGCTPAYEERVAS